jgi:hypothetical protein
VPALGEATLQRLLQLLGLRTGKLSLQCADQELDEFRPVADVDAMELAAKRDLVTPECIFDCDFVNWLIISLLPFCDIG